MKSNDNLLRKTTKKTKIKTRMSNTKRKHSNEKKNNVAVFMNGPCFVWFFLINVTRV